MPEYLRVKDKDTRHEYSIVASTFNSDFHVGLDKPATKADGTPLPPKHYVSKGKKSADRDFPTPFETNTGQQADTAKEID